MDMSEVRKFEGLRRTTRAGDAMRWLASEIRKPSDIRQRGGAYWNGQVHSACAIGKVWHQNQNLFHSPRHVDMVLSMLGFGAHQVHAQVIAWNDGEKLTFDQIADRLDEWARRIDANDGRYVEWNSWNGVVNAAMWLTAGKIFYVSDLEKGGVTVKVAANEGALV
jgi:hypothetical protein